jgi:hypothetical protein
VVNESKVIAFWKAGHIAAWQKQKKKGSFQKLNVQAT